ncbi:MAG: anion transporter [Desulfobacterales bacterium]|nr:MAG: anion transporter [Desulfobacterales bacterium]
MKLLFFTGKGGVGKSTLAAASAWQLSHEHRVLVASLDPAHNLGDLFGVEIKDEHSFSDTLRLKEVDLKKRSRDYLQKEVTTLKESYRHLQVLNLDTCFSVLRYSPGIEEYALLTAIEETIADAAGFDYIIFDTPPTGLTLRFLALPQVTGTWIERLAEIRRTILEKSHTIRNIRGKNYEDPTILDYDEDHDDILQKLIGLKSRYQNLNRLLQGPDCSIALVFNPDLLSLKESLRLVAGLQELGLPLRLLLNNKVSEQNRTAAEQVEQKLGTVSTITPKRIHFLQEFQTGHSRPLYQIRENLVDDIHQV